MSGHDKHFNIDSSDASEFTGTIQLFDDTLTSNGRIIMATTTYSWKNKALQTTYSASNISLPNATLEMNGSSKGFSELAFYTGNSNLTIGTLNGNEYSRILKANNNSTAYCNLTVSEGNYAGEIGRHYHIPQDEPGGSYCFVNHINLIKVDEGTLTLSGKNYFFGTTTVSGGTLKLTADAVVTTGLVSVESNGTLEYNVGDGQTKLLTITSDNAISSTGTIKKTGDGTLQILTEAANLVSASSWVVSSGRMDMKEYFTGSLTIGEQLDSESYTTATFSPGNSVGDLTITGDFTLNPGSTLLSEFDETGADSLQVTGTTEFGENTFIDLALEEGASPSPNQQLTFQLPANIIGFDNATISYPSYLTGVSYNSTTGVLSAAVDANSVPEPSTWALLALGAAGLLYWRKRKYA